MDGAIRTVRTLPFLPGGLEVMADGRLIVGDAQRREIYVLTETGSEQLADLSNLAGFFLNDSVIDKCGNLYVTDAGFDFMDPLVDPLPNGVIFYVRADGKSSVVAEDLFLPNGLIVTSDNKTLIVAETLGNRLTAFDIEDDGTLKNRRVWARFQHDIKPNGICPAGDDAVWVAGEQPYAFRINEDGEIDQQITTSRPVFATMLGGPERDLLFLCTSDSNDPVITRRFSSATIEITIAAAERRFDLGQIRKA